jgi:Photosynthetic reaction centre cytochrome C subunit.
MRARPEVVFLAAAILALSCVAPSTTVTPTTTIPPTTTPPVATVTPARVPGQRPILTDSARRVRDSITAFRRDSLMKKTLASIAGQENVPAESVFTNIQIFKGVPAGKVVHIMGEDFGPALGVGCGFCHTIGEYDKDSKQEKKTSRIMFKMTQVINAEWISQVPLEGARPRGIVGCSTCHRGSMRPRETPPGGPPPGARPGQE